MKGDKTVSSAVSIRSLGMFREIAPNVRHGLRRKVSLGLTYVPNQILLKFLLILGGLTQVPLFMFLIRCRAFLQSKL